MMWSLWPLVCQYGQRASQFVDLLGYFSLNVSVEHKVRFSGCVCDYVARKTFLNMFIIGLFHNFIVIISLLLFLFCSNLFVLQ